MAESTAPPPPAPPPPPPLFNTPKILAPSQRKPANREHVGSLRPTQSSERPPFAGVHPETLQHAAASLRKTQHNKSIFPFDTESSMGGSYQLPDRGSWSNFAHHEPMEQHQARTAVHASSISSPQSVPIRVDNGYSIPIKISPTPNTINPNAQTDPNNSMYSYSFSSSSSSNNNNDNFLPNLQPTVPNPQSTTNFLKNNGQTIASSTLWQPSTPSNPPSHKIINVPILRSTNLSTDPSSSPLKTASPTPFSSQSNTHSCASYITNPIENNRTNNSQKITENNNSFSNDLNADFSRNLIINPQLYIRKYATQTPVRSIIPPPQPEPAPNTYSSYTKHFEGDNTTNKIYTNNNTFGSKLQNNSPTGNTMPNTNNFAKELRDSGLTERQKYSNQFQKPVVLNRNPPNSMQNLYRETTQRVSSSNNNDPVNDLIKDMEFKMRTGVSDFCQKCGKQIVGDTPGVTALGNAYHVSCFTCDECSKQLAGCSFYSVDGKNLCQVDYMNSLEKCDKCGTPITQKILRAMGKPFHPDCFTCPACNKSLDGIPFTVDKGNQAYCLECYHERFSPRCAVCLKAIAPSGNETEVARVIAMDRSFHIDCYRCEDCGLKLNSKVEGQGCYPLESHLFCKNCNLNRLKNAT